MNDIFSVDKISFAFRMTNIDFTNDENIMGRIVWGYIYALNIKIHFKDV